MTFCSIDWGEEQLIFTSPLDGVLLKSSFL